MTATPTMPATLFKTGGFRPTNSMTESWIGRVRLYREDEDIPKDGKGNLMLPLCQLYLGDLSPLPEGLASIQVITIFMSQDFPPELTPTGEHWQIREYRQTDSLVMKDLQNEESSIQPFPLKPRAVANDCSVWDDDTDDDFDEDEEDSCAAVHHYSHKIGGYPSYCQSDIDFGDGFEYLFQITSDKKANLNIVDCGTIFFAKNPKTGEWRFDCDFY